MYNDVLQNIRYFCRVIARKYQLQAYPRLLHTVQHTVTTKRHIPKSLHSAFRNVVTCKQIAPNWSHVTFYVFAPGQRTSFHVKLYVSPDIAFWSMTHIQASCSGMRLMRFLCFCLGLLYSMECSIAIGTLKCNNSSLHSMHVASESLMSTVCTVSSITAIHLLPRGHDAKVFHEVPTCCQNC